MVFWYVLSLAGADLCCGVLIVPLSVYPALLSKWVYGDILCRLAGYVAVTLWTISVYTMMWMSVDRYLAVRKPLRYETVQTKTRCQCWVVFTWISSAMLCSPPLLDFGLPIFDKDSYLCSLNWARMTAYSITLAVLVLGPSLITIFYTYSYIFSMIRRLKSGAPIHDKEYVTALSENLANPSHSVSFAIILVFWLSWAPLICVRLFEYFSATRLAVPYLHFAVVWLGIANSIWKAFILVALSPQFRVGLRLLCLTLCCKGKSRLAVELLGIDADD